MTHAAKTLQAVRWQYGLRGDRPSSTDFTYALYTGVFAALVVGVPVVRLLAISLAQAAAMSAFVSPDSFRVVTVILGVLLAGLSGIGSVRGPALVNPYFVGLLVQSGIPRKRTLRMPFIVSAAVPVAIMVFAATLVGAVLAAEHAATLVQSVWFGAGVLCFAIVCSVVWLLSQRIGVERAWVLPLILLGVAVLSWVLPFGSVVSPAGWVGLLWPGGRVGDHWALAPLMFLAVCAVLWVPRLLTAISGPDILAQSLRWQTAGTAAFSGDFAGANATFRALPQLGRRWVAICGERQILVFLQRDLIGAARTPVRFCIGTVGLVAGATLIASAFTASDSALWLPACAGAVLLFLATGPFSDGLRHAAEAASAPGIYGVSNSNLFLLHALFPASWVLLSSATAGAIALGRGAGPDSFSITVLLCLFVLSVRFFDSLKGPLPPSLLTPIPTPFGDLSGLVVLAWQADGLILAVSGCLVANAVYGSGNLPGTMAAAAASLLGVVFLCARRFRRN